MNLIAFHALVRSLEFSPDAASAATALVDALTAQGGRAVVGLLKAGYGGIDLIATVDTPPGPPSAALLNWLAHPDAEWHHWRRPELLTASSTPDLAGLDGEALIIPLGDTTLYGVLAVQGGALTSGEIVLAAGLLAARLDRLAVERAWRTSTARTAQQDDSTLIALNELGRALASGLEDEALWSVLHEHINLLFDATSFFIGLYDRDTDTLALPLISEDGILTAGDAIPLCGFSRAVIAHGMELYFRDLEAEADRLAALGIRPDPREPGSYALSWMGVPLRGRHHDVIGLIALQNIAPASFDDASLALLINVAQQVALALDNIRLATSERERRTIVNALTELGQIVSSSPDYDEALDHMLSQLQRITQYDSANILLAPHGGETGPHRLLLYAFNSPELFLKGTEIVIPETHPIGIAIAARQPIQIEDAAAHPGWDTTLPLPDVRQTRALLIMPMIVYNRVAGVITLVRFSPTPFTEAQASSALALARQSAMALETARLRAQYQTSYQLQEARARRLESIHRISRVIASSLRKEEVLNAAARLLVELYQVDHCGIVMFDADGPDGTLVAEYPDMGHVGLRLHGQSLNLERILSAGAATVVEDSDETQDALRAVGARMALLAPMIARDKIIGSIGLDLFDRRRSFPEEDRETFVTIAAQIAMAISNAELYEKALEASRLKSEFLATMSHELRTPLNAILGYSDMLLQDFYGALSAQQRDRIERIHRSGQHLLAMINDVLDLSRFEAGQVTLNLSPGRVSDLAREIAAEQLPRAQAKGLTLTLETDPDEPLALIDPNYLRRALANLIDNAIKFTHQGGAVVRVGTRQVSESGGALQPGRYVEVQIQDSGIGIRREDLPIIFETFRQVDGSAVRQYEGTGMGLALTRQIISLHGGVIAVMSEVNRGSTFTILLPAAPAAGLPAETGSVESDDRLLILLFEDDVAQQELMRSSLNPQEFQLVATVEPLRGLELARTIQPDVIITDLMMPDMSGWDVLRVLKSDPATAEIPVIIMSIIDQRMMGLSMGASDYLIKPVKREALVNLLRNYRLRAERRLRK